MKKKKSFKLLKRALKEAIQIAEDMKDPKKLQAMKEKSIITNLASTKVKENK